MLESLCMSWKKSAPILSLSVMSLASSRNLWYVCRCLQLLLTHTFSYQRIPTPRFLRKWGSGPSGIAVHPHLDLVFLADAHNDQIQSFHGDGTPVKAWGSRGSADGQINFPHSLAVLARSQDRGHPDRNCVFVTDCYNHRIQVFGIDGSFIRTWGSEGQSDGQFSFPAGVAVHSNHDLVYVADNSNHRVQVFNFDGTFVKKWGTRGSDNGQFNWPCGVAAHPTRDLIFVCEHDHIHAFRSDGTFLFKWGGSGSLARQFNHASSLTLHPTRDLLFVTDSNNHRVQAFDLDGFFLCGWGSHGYTDGRFRFPFGISVHPSNDVVYISDNHCIQAFSLFQTSRKRKRTSEN